MAGVRGLSARWCRCISSIMGGCSLSGSGRGNRRSARTRASSVCRVEVDRGRGCAPESPHDRQHDQRHREPLQQRCQARTDQRQGRHPVLVLPSIEDIGCHPFEEHGHDQTDRQVNRYAPRRRVQHPESISGEGRDRAVGEQSDRGISESGSTADVYPFDVSDLSHAFEPGRLPELPDEVQQECGRCYVKFGKSAAAPPW